MRITQGRVASFVLGTVGASFAVNVLSNTWQGHRLLWSAIAAVTVLTAFLVPEDGLLRRERFGRTRLVPILSVILVSLYPISVWLCRDTAGFVGTFAPAVLLWLTSTLLFWTSSSRAGLGDMGLSSAMSISALAIGLYSIDMLLNGPGVLEGAATLLIGIACFLGCLGVLKSRPFLLRVAILITSAGIFLVGTVFLREESLSAGVAVLLTRLRRQQAGGWRCSAGRHCWGYPS